MENIIEANQIDVKDEAGRVRVRLSAMAAERPCITLYGNEGQTLELAMTGGGGEIIFQRQDGTRSIALKGDPQGGEFAISDKTGATAFIIRMNDSERFVEVFHPNGGSWRLNAFAGKTEPTWFPGPEA